GRPAIAQLHRASAKAGLTRARGRGSHQERNGAGFELGLIASKATRDSHAWRGVEPGPKATSGCKATRRSLDWPGFVLGSGERRFDLWRWGRWELDIAGPRDGLPGGPGANQGGDGRVDDDEVQEVA